jgi:hypothetical protein
MQDMQAAYDAWDMKQRFVFPVSVAHLTPPLPNEYYRMHMYRSIFLKWATHRYPATVPVPTVFTDHDMDGEWPARSALGAPYESIFDIGTLAEHHVLPFVARILSIDANYAIGSIHILLFTAPSPAREIVPFMLLYMQLTSLKKCVTQDTFFDPVAIVAAFDKIHGTPPSNDCMTLSKWLTHNAPCKRTLFGMM